MNNYKDLAKKALEYMQKTELKGHEVPAYIETLNFLLSIVEENLVIEQRSQKPTEE